MRKLLIHAVVVAAMATSMATAEQAVTKDLLRHYATLRRPVELRTMLAGHEPMARELALQLAGERPKDYKAEMDRQLALATLGRLLGLRDLLERQNLWVEDSRWGGADEVEAAVDLERIITCRKEMELCDRLCDQGAYQEALAHGMIAVSRHPFREDWRNYWVREAHARTFSLQQLLDLQAVGDTTLISEVEDLTFSDKPLAAEAVENTLSGLYDLTRSAEKAGLPLMARKSYQRLNKEALFHSDFYAKMMQFVLGTHLTYLEFSRQPMAEAQLKAEFTRLAALIDAIPDNQLKSHWAPTLGRALLLWREMAAHNSWFDVAADKWTKRFKSRQLHYAILRSRLLQAGQLRRQKHWAQAEAQIGAVEKALTSCPVDLTEWTEVVGKAVQSQEASLLTMETLRERARLIRDKNPQDKQALVYFQKALPFAYLPREAADLLNEESPLVRRLEPASFEAVSKLALEKSKQKGYRLGLMQASAEAGLFEAGRGNKSAALGHLSKAIELFERYLADLNPNAERQEALRAQLKEVYDCYALLKLEQGDTQGAFTALARQGDLSKASTVGSLRSQDPKLQARLEQAERAKEQVALASQSGKPELLAKTKAEFFTVVRDLRTQGKNYGGLLAVQPVEFAQLQKQLPADAVLVQYYPTEKILYYFVVSREGFKVRSLALPKAQLFQAVRDFRKECKTFSANSGSNPPWEWASPAGKTLLGQLSGLHRWLIEPLQEDLKGRKVLAVVPTEYLLYLPFPALARVDQGQPHFLVEDMAVVTLLRATDLAHVGKAHTPGGELLALGNPDGTLQGAEVEVRELGRSFPKSVVAVGKEATTERLTRTALPQMLHLATHAVLDRQQPNGSYLVLAGAGDKGRLKVPQIFDLPLQDTRLVTLSACETDLGESDPGAAVASLAEAFWVAGSPSLVASLWSVEDNSTGRLMINFYDEIQKGAPLGESLRRAQMGLLKDKRTGHPFYWAPFVLIGDWQ